MKFKQGTRVRVYGSIEDSHPKIVLSPGSVMCGEVISHDNGCVYFKDEYGCEYRANEKQCRRLKKKERRRVWLRLNLDGTVYDSTAREPTIAPEVWHEFIECVKKK